MVDKGGDILEYNAEPGRELRGIFVALYHVSDKALLIDDVLSELDNDRQTMLINTLGENQLFITTTEINENVANRLPAGKYFKIVNGEVASER